MSVRVKPAELLRLRCRRLALSTSDHASPVAAVRHLLALQAQDYPGAKWAIGLRVPGSTEADVDQALTSGRVVRSWPMRGTLHFVAAEDLGWMLALTTRRMLAGAATRQRQLGLDTDTLERAGEVTIAALSGGRALGRNGMMREFERGGIPTTGQRGYQMIWYLAQTGMLCWGPPDGRGSQSLVLLDEWVTAPRVLEREEALREFVLRYLGSHGPATVRDFAWWTKLTLADTKTGWALARDELTELVCGDTSYWMPSASADAATGSTASASAVYALPGFDEYLLGYQDRSLALDAEHAQRIVPGNNGMFMPTIVHRGRIVGTWQRRPVRKAGTDRTIVVQPLPFRPLSRTASAGFHAAARRYGRFLDAPVEVQPPPT